MKTLPLLSLLLGLSFAACSDDDPGAAPAELIVPNTYAAFENVSYEGQQQRIAMLGELSAYAKTGNAGADVDPARLSAMYRNEAGADFAGAYTKDLYSKTFAQHADRYDDYFVTHAATVRNGVAGEAGVAGIHTATSNGKTYALAANGVEYAQVIEKGLMGACFYYQANEVYLGDDRMSADNEVVEPGVGTEREHFFDEAFGYYGVPVDFPADTDGLAFWGDYGNDRDAVLSTNAIMAGFLRGRAAITAGDATEQARAVENVKAEWERVAAGSAIHYANLALAHADDYARRAHDLTEAIAFAQAIGYRSGGALTLAEVDALVTELAGAPRWADLDLYSADDARVVAFRDALAQATSLTDLREAL